MERPDSSFEPAETLALDPAMAALLRGGLPPPLQYLPGGVAGLCSLLPEPSPEVTPQQRLAHIVRTIEQDIIPRLLRTHAQAQPRDSRRRGSAALPAAAAQPDTLARLLPLVLAPGDEAWTQAIEAEQARGVAVEDLYLKLLSPLAQALGRLWDDDRISFTDVTLGVGRLQRSLRALSPAFDHDQRQPSDGRRVLLIAAPGNGHSFGLLMVAEFFRRAGWDVVCDASGDASDPVRRVRHEWFDVIGISVAGDDQRQWLPAGLAQLREASRNHGIGVMVGGAAFAHDPESGTGCGADCIVTDARSAPELAERLLGSRSGRLAAVG